MMLSGARRGKSNYNPVKCLFFILLPFLQRDRIPKLFQRNTSSSSITIERKNLFMSRSASVWIAVNYGHNSCVKGKNISVRPSKAGTVSSQAVFLQCPAETVVAFFKILFPELYLPIYLCYFYWFGVLSCSLISLDEICTEVNSRILSALTGEAVSFKSFAGL